ncbi:MAG: RNA methyltransferase [Prevotellaceae bacterium]|jgi:TrmH family RNA methyltransferase|nr:RNA methyltransferase [Prevotellaceae bacterium]
MPVSKSRIKFIRSLELKKFRKAESAFVAEGPKLVGDLLEHFSCRFLLATAEWLAQHPHLPVADIAEVSADELSRASLLKTPQQVLGVFEQRTVVPDVSVVSRSLCLALDGVQDPGNLGTIVRVADWFGIEHIFCSPDTADIYNPKAVQATMGGMARVAVDYAPLPQLIGALPADVPVYGTFLDGENIYRTPLSQGGLIVMGNEGNGISGEVERLVSRKLYIPSYPPERETSESLNVATATAIVCAEFRRQTVAMA